MTTTETLALIDAIRGDLDKAKRYIMSHPVEYDRLIEQVVFGLGWLTYSDMISEDQHQQCLGILDLGYEAHRVYPESFGGAVAMVSWVLGQVRAKVEKGGAE